MNIAIATSRTDLERCAPVMLQLRTHLSKDQFIEQVQRQQKQGYHLAYLEDGGEARALAGFRFFDMLAFGRLMYVDDLVTAEDQRSRGYGGRLFDWLVVRARTEACVQLHLDSGVQRFDAHRFYLSERMHISSHHFALRLDSNP